MEWLIVGFVLSFVASSIYVKILLDKWPWEL